MKLSRRKMLSLGVPALASAVLPASRSAAATPAPDAAPLTGTTWPEQRAKFERAWLDLLGDFPTKIPSLDPVIKEVAVENGITRYHVSFRAEEDDRVTAWLLVPDRARRKPAPAIVCLHSTTFGTGKDSTIGLAGIRPGMPASQWAEFYRTPEVGQAYGRDLAMHGYVTLMRSIDFLQTLDFVDGKRIGCTGWSLGGHCTLFAAAFDDRIGAAIPNGGVLDWHLPSNSWARPDDMEPSAGLIRRLGFNPHSGPYIYIKKFRPWVADPTKPLPVDFDSLMMMVAPRPLLILSSEWEYYSHKILPKIRRAQPVYQDWKDVPGLPSVLDARKNRRGYERTLDYYQHHNLVPHERIPRQLETLAAGDCFSWFSFPGGHSLPHAAWQVTCGWFDRWLGHSPADGPVARS